jgi:hypothetical protein
MQLGEIVVQCHGIYFCVPADALIVLFAATQQPFVIVY